MSSKLGGDYNDQFYYPSEDEVIAQAYDMASQGRNVFGKTPANKLNWLQDVASTLGVPITELFGAAPDYGPVPQMEANPALQVYGSNPVMSKAFDLIETEKMDPHRAYEAAVKANPGYKTSPEDRTADLDVINQYAFTQLKNQDSYNQAKAEYDRKAAGGGVSGWRSEQDLWRDAGMPVDDIAGLTNQLAGQISNKKVLDPRFLNTAKPKDNSKVSRIVVGQNGVQPMAQNGDVGQAATGLAKQYVQKRVDQAAQNKVRSRDNARAMQMMTMFLPLLQADS